MICGLEDTKIAKIINVLAQFEQVKKAAVFGSRATGTYKDNSDIDIVLYDDVDYKTLVRIKQQLEELPLPYFFDVKSYDAITHQPLKEHIDKYAKMIYKK